MTKEEIIKYLCLEPVEHIFILAKGKIIFHKVGDVSSVEVLDNDLILAKDNELWHNHPGGFPFSTSDVLNTINANAKGMTLVTPYYIYNITRPFGGWKLDILSFQEDYNKLDSWANEETDKLVLKNISSREEADMEKNHYIWLALFNKYDVKYSRKSIKSSF
jgi:hypothetical protein